MNVLLGITGSIAAYKSLELIRLLRKHGDDVRVLLTKSALNFVTQLSCQTLADSEVYFDQFVLTKGIKHLTLSDWSDILVIAPATANIIGKSTCGVGDDLLTTTVISYKKPILMVPAMDQGMWDNPVVQKNVNTLLANGVHVLEPGVGMLASGKIGRGRFPAVGTILKKIMTVVEKRIDLEGRRFLVTGGRTEEDIDPARVITNRSSGLMGKELLQATYCRSGAVRGIFGQVTCVLPEEVEITRVRTSAEMLHALKNQYSWCDCLIMAAAVGDYKPVRRNAHKKHAATYRTDLVKNIDLTRELSKHKAGKLLVGFSLEDSDGLARAREKMKMKNLDMVVLNTTAAIGQERIKADILKKRGRPIALQEMTKWELANRILDECIVELRAARQK
jgi:phosphopantothenoylcysteine decarboxylase/phosphopantothenate--cysteine ligase